MNETAIKQQHTVNVGMFRDVDVNKICDSSKVMNELDLYGKTFTHGQNAIRSTIEFEDENENEIEILITERQPHTAKMLCEHTYDRCFKVPFIHNIVNVKHKTNENEVDNFNVNGNEDHNNMPNLECKCDNDNFEKCCDIFKDNANFMKMIHFNAQGLLEGMHLEHISLVNNAG